MMKERRVKVGGRKSARVMDGERKRGIEGWRERYKD